MAINWYPGHMQKTKRQIKENIDLIDIVYEVIDEEYQNHLKTKTLTVWLKTSQEY